MYGRIASDVLRLVKEKWKLDGGDGRRCPLDVDNSGRIHQLGQDLACNICAKDFTILDMMVVVE